MSNDDWKDRLEKRYQEEQAKKSQELSAEEIRKRHQARQGLTNNNQAVIVTDIHMPFMSMVVFMVKWAIAAIPAVIILSVLFGILATLFTGFISSP